MRIGLDFRFLALGRQGLVRGIPRFTQEQLQSVLALDSDNTYLLLCDAGVDLDAILPEIRAAANAHVVCAPDELGFSDVPARAEHTLLAWFSAYQQWLEGLRLDLYHATCPAWLNGTLMPGFDVCPYVATAYDLIPLLYPAQYLHDDAWLTAYTHRLLFLEQATRIAAISHATGGDLIAHLGIAADRIDVTPPAASPCFRPLPPDVAHTVLSSLDHPSRRLPRRRVRIPSEYLLCLTDLHYTKNLVTLVTAYAGLPTATRARFPLVVAGHLDHHGSEDLRRLAGQLEVDANLILTGRLSDQELVALYSSATIMVHPSHHEGFGLPVAEAMRCGAPVITTTRSSLPEIVADAAVLVDSEDATALRHEIDRLLHDRQRREDLRRRGLAQATRYSADALGRATLDCYQKAAVAEPRTAPGSLRVAIWSPVPPQTIGTADYADDLITALAAEPGFELDIFVDDDVLPPTSLMRKAGVHHCSDFDRYARRAAFDCTIYQLGASSFHLYMERALLSHPGIVVLHDLQWGRAKLAAARSEAKGLQRFRAEVAALEGQTAARHWDRVSALPLPARHEAERAFLNDHLMLGRVLDAATRCVTLTPEAAHELVQRYPRATPPVTIPMGVHDPQEGGYGFDRATARGYLGIDPAAFLLVAPGTVERGKHIDAVIDAFADLRRTRIDALLAVVGFVADSDYAATLQRHAEARGVRDVVRFVGSAPRIIFDAFISASDAVMVLRDLRSQEMSGSLTRALAAGRCVVMSDIPSWGSVPDTACIRVAAPPHERDDLTVALREFATDTDRRAHLERAARAHFEATARPERMVDGYRRLISDQAGRRPSRRSDGRVSTRRSGRSGRPLPRTGALPYSKVCELEDFEHPQLREVIRDVCSHKASAFGADFPRRCEHRKDWEVAMAVRALADHGALRPDARLLGVAAGTEDTVFYLTRNVREVVAIDRYRSPGDWEYTAPSMMLTNPGRLAPYAFAVERLTVQHRDARILDFPDESFDGIFSSGSIEHFGDLQTIAAAAYEMGRVLKPGGILSVSTELLLSADAQGPGSALPGTLLFSPAELRRYIVEASGLEPIDELDLSVSHWTHATSRDIHSAVASRIARQAAQPIGSRGPDWMYWDIPHIVMDWNGKRFTSVHLALRRAAVHPVVDNSWAGPSAALRADVAASMAETATVSEVDDREVHAARAAVLAGELSVAATRRAAADNRLEALRGDLASATADLDASLQEASLPQAGVYKESARGRSARSLRRVVTSEERFMASVTGLPPPGTVACPIVSPLAPPYKIVVERDAHDIISLAFLAGHGPAVNRTLISLILALVPACGTLLDLGANVGSISMPVAVTGRHVLSVEADPVNVSLLQTSAVINDVSDRMHVIATAAGGHVGEASFMPHGAHGQILDAPVNGAIRVPLTTVDALVASENIDRVDLVKVDVEGAEMDVLRGMRRLVEHPRAPYLLVECCPHTLAEYGQTTADLVALLEAYGYVVYNVEDNRLMRRRPDEVQVTTVMDVLAAKQGLRRLPGWRLEPPMGPKELVQRLLTESRHTSPDHRASVARVACNLSPEILDLPAVSSALNSLRNDPQLRVRAAAAWWRHARAEDSTTS